MYKDRYTKAFRLIKKYRPCRIYNAVLKQLTTHITYPYKEGKLISTRTIDKITKACILFEKIGYAIETLIDKDGVLIPPKRRNQNG